MKLASQWTQPKPDDYLESVHEVFLHHPLELVERCVNPIRGIARTKVNGEPRRYPPSVSEIIDWLECTPREGYCAPRPTLPIGPPPPPASPENIAQVQATLEKTRASLTRAMGGKSPEDLRTEAQQILDRYDREAKEAALAAIKARQSPPSDGAHAGRALADLEARRATRDDSTLDELI